MSYVIAHRGASFHAPENTLSAFRKAMELGADGIETDVQITADGRLVILHNYHVDLTTFETGRVVELTLDQLRQMDFGIRKGPEFAGETIATLEEALEVVKPMRVVNVELKAPADRSIPFVERVVESVKAHGMTDNVIISSFQHDLLRQVKELCPQLRVGVLTFPPLPEGNPWFRLLEALTPEGVPLGEIDLNGLTVPAEAAAAFGGGGMGEVQAREVLCTIMALYPDAAGKEAVVRMQEQRDIPAYLDTLDFPVDYLHPHYLSLFQDETILPKMKEKGIGVSPWTVDGEAEMAKLDGPCCGLITNRPDLLLEMQGRAKSEE